jgi:hypothetical protein
MKPILQHYSRIPSIEKPSQASEPEVMANPSTSVKRVDPQTPHSSYSLAHDASRLICSTKAKFYCLKIKQNEGVFELECWGSALDAPTYSQKSILI